MQFFCFFFHNFVTTNLNHLKFWMTHFFYVPWMMFVFPRPKRPYQGKVSDLLAFVKNFFWKFSKVYPKGARIFKKKVFWKNVPRLPAFKTTLSFKINFLWSYTLEINQIQIMLLLWLKLHFHQKILAFKGWEGQERPCNFFQHSLAVINLISMSFFFKNMQLLFYKKSRPPSPFGSTLLQHGLPGL